MKLALIRILMIGINEFSSDYLEIKNDFRRSDTNRNGLKGICV
mgnify:CR=1 FL=1